jgi:hypothetical protein
MTADGYPVDGTSALTYTIAKSFTDSSYWLSPATTWVMEWQGTGQANLHNGTSFGATNFIVTNIGAGTTVIGSGALPWTSTNLIQVTGTNGYIEFTNGSGAFQYTIDFPSGKTYTNFTNLRIYRKSDQAALNGGQIFTSEFLSSITALNPSVLRTMDWTNTNNSNLANWANRSQTSHISYLGGRLDPTLYGGVAVGPDTYACSAPSGWGGLVDGATVQVYFQNANTITTPTLNVASTGAITITSLTNGALSAGTIPAGSLGTLVYNTWLNAWIARFSNPSSFQSGGSLTATMPVEIMVALANTTNMDLWINIPHLASTSFSSSMASLIASTLNSNLNCYFEFSNEVWNSAPGFSQTNISYAIGAYLGFPASSNRQQDGYYGLKVSQHYPVIKTAWLGAGRTVATLRRVMAVWIADPSPVSASQGNRMNGGDLNTSLGYVNYNAQVGVSYNAGSPTFSRPIDQCEVIAYAPYFNGGCINDGGGYGGAYPAASVTLLQAAADNYASNIPASMDAALQWVDFDTRRGSKSQQAVTIGGDTKTFTVPGAAPANNLFVSFYTTGVAFSGIDYTQIYWVVNSSGSTFQISAARSGAAITGISGGSGTQYTGVVSDTCLQRVQAVYFAPTNTYGFGWAQIAASYNGVRPPGSSNLGITCYEGGLQSRAPTSSEATTIGASGYSASITTLLAAYKNHPIYGCRIATDYVSSLTSITTAQGVTGQILPSWFSPFGPNQWALYPGGPVTTPFQTWNGLSLWNKNKRRLTIMT